MRYRLKFILKVIIILLIPLIYEYVGINYGGPLGVRYYYSPSFKPQFLGLPLFAWIFWVIFILVGYNLTNSIFINLFKFDYKNLLKNSFYFLNLILFDGFIVLTFDLFIDPIAVKYELWRWENFKFSYFGVPVGNFVGWYIIVSSTTFLLRQIDRFYFIKHNERFLKLSPIIYLIIILISFIFSLTLLNIDHALLSLIISSPINLISLILIKQNFSKRL